MIFKGLGVTVVTVVAFVLPAWAHHSHAMYDSDAEVTLVGTITEYDWVNPHIWIYMDVEGEDGQLQEWVLEGGGPGTLTRRGWSGMSFAPGERITAKVRPMKDGSSGALLRTLIKEDGTEFDGS